MTNQMKKLSPSGQAMLNKLLKNDKLDDSDRTIINMTLKKKLRNPALYTILAIFFPINHFLCDEVVKGLLFWVTGGGLCFWYFINWFTAASLAREANDQVVTDLLIAYGK
jgi:TM2 domain-containing membrane protein YozV